MLFQLLFKPFRSILWEGLFYIIRAIQSLIFQTSSRALQLCHSSAEGVALGRVQGGHLEAAPHAGPRPLAGHHGLQEVGARLIVLLLPQLPLVPQARLHHVEAGALQGRLGVLQADGEGRQLQQVILKITRSYKEVLSQYLI